MMKATSSRCLISPHLAMMCHPVPRHFLPRPQLLTRLYAFKGGVLTTTPGIDRPRMFDLRRRAAVRWDTRFAALLERLTPIIDGAVFLL